MPERAAIQVDGTCVTGIDLSGATISSCLAVVVPAGARFAFTAAGPYWGSGSGSPEGVHAWPQGSLWSRTDSASALYVKQTVTAASTGWALK